MKKREEYFNFNKSSIIKRISKMVYTISLVLLIVITVKEELIIYLFGTLVIASILRIIAELLSEKRLGILFAHGGICLFSIMIIWFFLKTGVVITTIYY